MKNVTSYSVGHISRGAAGHSWYSVHIAKRVSAHLCSVLHMLLQNTVPNIYRSVIWHWPSSSFILLMDIIAEWAGLCTKREVLCSENVPEEKNTCLSQGEFLVFLAACWCTQVTAWKAAVQQALQYVTFQNIKDSAFPHLLWPEKICWRLFYKQPKRSNNNKPLLNFKWF